MYFDLFPSQQQWAQGASLSQPYIYFKLPRHSRSTQHLLVVSSCVPSTLLTSAIGTAVHLSVAIAISFWIVSLAFSTSTNQVVISLCNSCFFSTSWFRANIPPVFPLPFPNPACSSPIFPFTIAFILPSRILSSNVSVWLSKVMHLYFSG